MFCAWFEVDQPLHDERLEQLERHLLGQAALVQLQLRADDDDRTAGVVDALAEQVLAEPALLALEHVGQRLQRPVARAGHRTAAAAVVEQRVDGLLEHPLLVVDDDLGRAEVEQPLEAVVAVDDAAVEVVQVGRREPAAVELHHRAQVRRDDRDDSRGPCPWAVARSSSERGDDLEPLEGAGLLLARGRSRCLAQLGVSGVEVEVLEPLLDRRGAHAALEVQAEPVAHLAVEDLVALEVLDLEVLEAVPDLLEPLELLVRALADVVSSRARPTRGPCASRRPWRPRPRARRGPSRGSSRAPRCRRRGGSRSPSSRPGSAPRARAGRWWRCSTSTDVIMYAAK